jgi:hypothetical protein
MDADAKERTVGANIEKHLAARLLDAQAGPDRTPTIRKHPKLAHKV